MATRACRLSKVSGIGIIELMVVAVLAIILGGIGIVSFKELRHPARDSADQLAAFFSLARSQAIASTGATRVVPVGVDTLTVFSSTNCQRPYPGSSWLPTGIGNFRLEPGASLSEIVVDSDTTYGLLSNWPGVCFDSRGIVSSNVIFRFSSQRGNAELELMLGGGTETNGG